MNDSPVTIVFGAYGGIGSALSRRLSEAGHRLVVAGRDPVRLHALASELSATEAQADALNETEIEAAIALAVDEYGRLDGVVNCIGSVLLKPAHLTRPEEWAHTVGTNLTSAFSILRASVRPLMKSGGGSLVFVSSAAASIGLPNHEAVAAAKGGIEAMVRSAAATYGKSSIRVNAVSPGLVETPLTERITSSDSARAGSERMHALRRIGQPDEIAGAIAWLLSSEAAWVTGEVLRVDGGLGSVRSA